MGIFIQSEDAQRKLNLTTVSGNDAADVNITQSVPLSTTTPAGATTVVAGDKTVAVSGTAEALAATSTIMSVTVQAKVANTNNVMVGNATTQDVELTPGDSVTVNIDDPAKVFIDVVTNGEGVDFIGVA